MKRHLLVRLLTAEERQEDAQDIQNMLDFLDSTTPFDTLPVVR
jgi:hypothetical protein